MSRKLTIYEVHIESRNWGRQYRSLRILATTCDEAIRKAKRDFASHERLQSVDILATTSS